MILTITELIITELTITELTIIITITVSYSKTLTDTGSFPDLIIVSASLATLGMCRATYLAPKPSAARPRPAATSDDD